MNPRAIVASLIVVAGWCVDAGAAEKRYPYQSCFDIAARLSDVPVELLLAVARTESNWDPTARSHANAHGIMQIQWPGTARHLGFDRVAELYNPCANIEAGARYLRELLDSNGGNVDRALAAYNYGPARIAKSPSVPAGAKRYAQTVANHRAVIGSAMTKGVNKPASGASQLLASFGSPSRANAFAGALSKQVKSATFHSNRQDDGTYGVEMRVAATGLTTGDTARLASLRVLQVDRDWAARTPER
jgi:hypothetical protein